MIRRPAIKLRLAPLAAALTLLATETSSAQSVEEFYKGRNVSLIISSGAGGGYDAYSRTLARHIGRHIPGRPRIVPQNMPGAGSLIALNHIANAAARDGSVFSDADSTMPFYSLFEGQNTKFDPFRLNWLGSVSLFKTAVFKNYQTEKLWLGTDSYMLCIGTCCMSGCRRRGASNSTGE